MDEYSDYVKGGDILMAPSIQSKHRYILKCIYCHEYYSDFDPFFTHYIGHKEEMLYNDEKGTLCGNVEISDLDDKRRCEDGYNDATKFDSMREDLEDDALMNTEKVYIKDEPTFDEIETSNHSLEVIEADGLNIESSSNHDEPICKDVEVAKVLKDCNVAKCVRDFMKKKVNVIALIKAYKAQPFLWNVNYLPHRRAKERQNCLQQIVNSLKSDTNLTLSCNEVSSILVFMRHKYKESLRSVWQGDDKSCKHKNLGYLKHLEFLKPFIENNSIVVISEERPHLSPEQIKQIFNIYKNFPHLWDSNLVENVCTNKRNEAIKDMLNVINNEMSLYLDQSLLENYVSSIHAYCSKEKRRDINSIKSKEARPAYYEHIKFLYKHVAPFKCPTCLRDFRNPLYFKEHLIEHDDTMRLKCSQCDKEYKSAALYMEHAKRHMNDVTKECKVCGKQFLKTRALTHHMRIHTGDKPYVCDICGNSFRHIQTLNAHKRTHNKDYMHFCPVCSKGFYTKSTMNVHVATHRNERNHVCQICGKAFKTKINLSHHEWTHEDGCYPCEQCGKTYKSKYNLQQHTKTHRKKIEIA